MRKSPHFLHIFKTLALLLFSTTLYAAGYECSDKEYTACNSGYYMNKAGVGNACILCSTVNSSITETCTTETAITGGKRVGTGSRSCKGKFTGGNGSDGSTGKIGTGTCTGCSDWNSCSATSYACTCNTGFQVKGSGSTCSCCQVAKACNTLGTGWTGTYNECTANQGSACSKPCSVTCSGNNIAQCPEHATCTYNTTYQYTATQYYGGNCNTGGLCPMLDFTCPDGYVKNGNECQLNTFHCPAGQYLPMGQQTCKPCTAGNYCPGGDLDFSAVMDKGLNACPADYRDGGTGLATQDSCVGIFKKYGDQIEPALPAGCINQTTVACTPGECSYKKQYNGTLVGPDCTPTDCTKDRVSVVSDAGHYADGLACRVCPTGYPNALANSIAITDCFSDTKLRSWSGSIIFENIPQNCRDGQWTSVPKTDCEYVAFSNAYGTGDGVIKSGCTTNENTFYADLIGVWAKPGYYVEGLTCPICDDGSYCPGEDAAPVKCPADGDGTDVPRDSLGKCYQLCDLQVKDVEFAVRVEPDVDRVYAESPDAYPTCTYTVTCRNGYIDEIDIETHLPVCRDIRRLVVLDDQKPSTPAGIKNLYLEYGKRWYEDFEMTSPISGIAVLPTKIGYDFGGYYTQPQGAGIQIVDPDGDFVFSQEALTFAGIASTKIYAYWIAGKTTCSVGQYYADGLGCRQCLNDNYCPGGDFETNGGTQGLNPCVDLGDGQWTSSQDAGAPTECFARCDRHTIVGGIANPVNSTEFYPNTCSFTGTSDSGNPCDVVDGVCVEKFCRPDFELINGVCEPCDREFALEYMANANCKITNCIAGYHPNTGGLACEPDEIECTAPNTITAVRIWNNAKKTYSNCTATECESGYHVLNGACVTDEQSCTVAHGVGVREWDMASGTWGPCIAIYCDPGYTDIAAESDEPNAPCGRCRNYYSILGEPAASSYVQGCELASCLYSGEKYILDGNECRPICENHSDETGTMKWNPATKKCERICNPGYAMW